MDKAPDFVGKWFYGDVHQDFSMHIESRQKLVGSFDNVEEIKGTILDVFGEASFEGRMGRNKISFVKKYCLNAVEKGGVPLVMYSGIRMPDYIETYAGEYVICEKHTVCEKLNAGLIILAHNDEFIMRKYFDVHNN